MGRPLADGSEARFAAYVEGLASVIGHADRVAPLEAYCIGLLMPGERKSVEPMAAITAPERVSAQQQSRPGSSRTRAFPNRGNTRSAWRVNTAASLANRIIARSR